MKLIIDVPDEVMKNQSFANHFGAWSDKLQSTIETATPLNSYAEDDCIKFIESKCYTLINNLDFLKLHLERLNEASSRFLAGDHFLLTEMDHYSRNVLISKEQCYTQYCDISHLAHELGGEYIKTFEEILERNDFDKSLFMNV